MKVNALCRKLVVDFPISCLETDGRRGRVAWMRRVAVSVSIAMGLIAGANAMGQTTYTVTTTVDPGGSCSGSGAAITCTSLRAAMTAASGTAGDRIDLTGLSGTITLQSALPQITSAMQNVTIVGPGASLLTISGNGAYQIFNISSGVTVAIFGLTLANGSSQYGGAINSNGTLTVTDSAFSGDTAVSYGGAISNDFGAGTLTVTNSTFSGNSGGANGIGGAIDINSGTATVTNSTFSGNSALSGGAIYIEAGSSTVTNSTFSSNSAYGAGAIGNYGALTADNNIFSGNSSVGGRAGIFNGGTVNADHNLYYHNLDGGTTEDDCSGCNSNTNAIAGSNPNLLPLALYGGLTQTMLPQPGSPAICAGSYADVPNGVVADQRGFPLTNPACASGQVDVGAVQSDYLTVTTTADSNDGACTYSLCSLRDAITAANTNTLLGNPYGADIDFETGLAGTINLGSALPAIYRNMVILGPGGNMLTISGSNNYQIFNISNIPGGAVTLSGLTLANGRSGSAGGAIEDQSSGLVTLNNMAFESNIATTNGGAVYNGSGPMTVTNSNFGGNDSNRSGGAIYNNATLTVTGTNFAGNFVVPSGLNGFGGAIENGGGTLTITSSTFASNYVASGGGSFGGAIGNYGSLLTITGSTFSGNFLSGSGAGYGGAILDGAGMTVVNSTFSGNSVPGVGSGGAIFEEVTATVTGNTFSGNSAPVGGAIDTAGVVTANNNIFTGNSAFSPSGGGGILNNGTFNGDNNLFYNNLAGGAEDDCDSCTSNQNAITGSDPLLAPLGVYGGFTQTMLPAPGSPAICAGSQSLIPSGVTADQRGFNRVVIYSVLGSPQNCVDLGAVQTDYTAVALSSSSYSAFAGQNVNPAPVVTVTENGQNIGGVPVTLAYSGTGAPTGLGPVTTVSGTGAAFSGLTASAAAQGTLSVSLPITAASNNLQPAPLTASASLNIQSTAQTIVFAAPSTATYGAVINLSASGGGSGMPVVFSLDASSKPGAATLNGNVLTVTGVGTIVIDANQAAGNGYVAATQAQRSIMANPASLTVTASSPTVVAGAAVPAITASFSGFVNGDTSAVLSTQPTCTTTYTTASAAGSSPATSCSGAAAANYTFTYVGGKVTVTAAPTFAVSGASSSISIAPGATTGNTVQMTVTPGGGFTGTVSLSCSVSPAAASDTPTCSLSPSSVAITGAGAQTSTLTITTTAAVGENRMKELLWPSAGTALALVLMIGVPRRRRNWPAMLGILALMGAIGALGCGSGSSGGSGSGGVGSAGTTAGNYTVTVTGTASGGVTGTVATIAVAVQ